MEGTSLNADQALKLRTVEMNLIDFKGHVDRKMNEFSEEMPNLIKREIKGFENRE